MIPIISPTEDMLTKSIRNAIKFYQIFLVLWLGSIGWFVYSKDSYWLIYSIFFFVAAINYNLSQKIDKSRLEALKHE